ncbi:hypothetical protein LTR66_013098 [Elasticomyces elasticus]|nr:hypothetical protein LTR66_013098 [Elasticomyces elasticus]
MDTGPLDSHNALGINTSPEQRITYRKVTTCAPLHTRGFEDLENFETANGTAVVARYYSGGVGGGFVNYTYQYLVESVHDGFGCEMKVFDSSYTASPSQLNAWTPSPELNRTDADVTIMFLNQNKIEHNSLVPTLPHSEVLGQYIYVEDDHTWIERQSSMLYEVNSAEATEPEIVSGHPFVRKHQVSNYPTYAYS